MHIERRQEEGAQKIAIFHKEADIPGGVTVKTTGLTADILPEATLITRDSGKLWKAIASAKVVEAATTTATDYIVAKGHLFNVGDKINKTGTTDVNITAIDTTDPSKDKITVDATLGAKAINTALVQGGEGQALAITGEAQVINKGRNLPVSAWVRATVNSAIVPEPANKPAGVIYITN
ncbi:hypothetical protein [Soonwooa purpurea]